MRKYTISPDGFDPFGIKHRLSFVRGFILESHVTLLRQKHTREVDLLPVDPRDYPEVAPIGLTFSNFNFMGGGFMTVIVSAMSYPIRNA